MSKFDFGSVANDTFTTIDGREFKVGDHFRDKDFVVGEDGGVFVKHPGLLRVLKKLFHIWVYKPDVIQAPQVDNQLCAVVQVRYEISHNGGERYSWTSVADCHRLNSNAGFERYTTTMAETRASARALRNILGVEYCSKEEISDNTVEMNDGQIQQHQVDLLEKKFMNDLKFTLEDMSKEVGKKLNTLKDLTESEAAQLIERLNKKRRKRD